MPTGTTGIIPVLPIGSSHGPISLPPVNFNPITIHKPAPVVVKRHTASAAPSGLPPAPLGLTAQSVSPTQINVYWKPVPGAGLFILYRSGGPGSDKGTRTIPAGQTFITDTGLTPGVVYHYRIQSKRGHSYGPQSKPTSALTPSAVVVPATVQLTVTDQGKNLYAVLDFVNVSKQAVYLDKISACEGGRIRDSVFRVLVDGQNVPFSGRKSGRPVRPGPRQFITLLPGENVHESVKLNQAYRLPSGAHTYSVAYSGPHIYPDRVQAFTLTSNSAQLKTYQ